ncbi:hypothetical protein [Nocardioides sp. Leaf307]|uniref:hypothetical protein n=1 Tax=Nocardioides sp. Leaf307 TaxID=1736331 RepID=UPI0012EAF490|nr:hypothetical protein [Nocardioides sp. Leaf307]
MAIANGKYKGGQLSILINNVEYKGDLTNLIMNNEEADSDATTFADEGAGGALQWFMEGTAVSDFGTGSLWNYAWTNSGQTGIAFVYKPYGNATATAAKPHFTGTLTLPAKPPVGGAAGETWSWDVRMDIAGTPTMVVA